MYKITKSLHFFKWKWRKCLLASTIMATSGGGLFYVCIAAHTSRCEGHMVIFILFWSPPSVKKNIRALNAYIGSVIGATLMSKGNIIFHILK